jgi:uncharacterized protein DUF1579
MSVNWMGGCLCAALALGAGWASAQDTAKKPAPPKPEEKKAIAPAADEKAMMEKWLAASTPGAPHKALATLEGSWTAKVKTWMAPGAPPESSDGTAEQKMLLGGRFLEQHYSGSMMGQPFQGVGHTGYDNLKKKYVATWIDSMGTMTMVTEGTADATGKVITSTGTIDDVMTGKPAKIKTVVTIVDPDHHTYEMWAPGPDGKAYKNVEVQYSRKK